MDEITFFLNINPYGKGRARTFMRKGITRTITPPKTKEHSNQMFLLLIKELDRIGFKKPFDGPVEVEYIYYFRRPLTVENRIYPTVKFDLDNLDKQQNDTFNKLVWNDDSQIIRCISMKLYAGGVIPPGIQVRVKQLMTKEQNEAKPCKTLRK